MEEKTIFVDVRNRDEYEHGHVDGAISVPLDELQSRCSVLNGKQVTVICNHGGQRSHKAKEILDANGIQAQILHGGYCEWKEKQDKREER